jgi:hypothetical protein
LSKRTARLKSRTVSLSGNALLLAFGHLSREVRVDLSLVPRDCAAAGQNLKGPWQFAFGDRLENLGLAEAGLLLDFRQTLGAPGLFVFHDGSLQKSSAFTDLERTYSEKS